MTYFPSSFISYLSRDKSAGCHPQKWAAAVIRLLFPNRFQHFKKSSFAELRRYAAVVLVYGLRSSSSHVYGCALLFRAKSSYLLSFCSSLHLMPYFIHLFSSFSPSHSQPANFLPSQLGCLHHIYSWLSLGKTYCTLSQPRDSWRLNIY